MKFGEYLLSHRIVGWEQYYLDYIALKNLIKALQDAEDNHEAGKLGKGSSNENSKVHSFTRKIPHCHDHCCKNKNCFQQLL
jgi:SPX domain protein involved in polyphosphate accumulation